MKVHFSRGWFAPGAVRYKKSANRYDYREVPDELRKHLPKTAKIIENPEAAPAPVKETLRDHDTERTGRDIVQAKIDAAEKRGRA